MKNMTATQTPKPITYATVTWDQLHRDARTLATTLMEKHGPFRGIVAITRGGLIPAAILGREMGCRLIESVSVISYAGEEGTQHEPKVVKAPTAAGDGEGFLIVDDLVDSGVTAKYVREMLPKAVFACLYAKPDGKPHTDHYVTEVAQDTWVLFPWDTAPLFVPPLVRNEKE
ncbi:xanthine phosphoribosyltransferase [Gluconobacter japonicus]|uniref:Xanthine-guanine phosphoribosyltransferase n=1 Tax=Gluconobacter japonicus TaxID=376620 RepID=A0A149SE84_GLUJA|nr:xanthine phosphoribosyltransferase [Gluconobacter japonicus]GAP24113.1 xanthine-guanine phosphoribosyltransferase [Gluconobacter frateurii NBRC 101659]KXV23036.1 xanthine-guanine phosphoribosyltransferase [Gluconobacter japonicus]KXV24218.1 xanthine-guanine phosphoribosyltransferase [Gluconobacter japonicus]KXV25752.1 xanthine-guanine phosphoribosyltransferase [Gluconobacter japonicus]KXV38783.1 xanthine-guanine phosphoribosyltransferase [Gluconobacter japonicus]